MLAADCRQLDGALGGPALRQLGCGRPGSHVDILLGRTEVPATVDDHTIPAGARLLAAISLADRGELDAARRLACDMTEPPALRRDAAEHLAVLGDETGWALYAKLTNAMTTTSG